jgi:transcriptional pleiotropic regulator of transition state genes
MKATGIVRRMDELGRIVIPKELRRTMHIDEGDALEIFVEGERIVLRKYQPCCVNCGDYKEGMISVGVNVICPDCVRELSKQVVLDKTVSKHK